MAAEAPAERASAPAGAFWPSSPESLRVWRAPPPPDRSGSKPEAKPEWTEWPSIPMAADWRTGRTYGSALGIFFPGGTGGDGDGPRLLAVRADADAVRAWVSESAPPPRWEPARTVLPQGRAESWAASRLLAALAALAAVTLGLRLAGERGIPPWRPAANPGAAGTLLDRALALAIDSSLILPLPAAYHWHGSDYGWRHCPPEQQARLFVAWLAGLALYKALSEAVCGTTLGKKLLGLRVRSARPGGGPASAGQSLVRNLALVLDCFPLSVGPGVALPYAVALAVMAFNRRRRRLGDWLAGTAVRRHVPPRRRVVWLASGSPRRLALLREAGYAAVAAPAGGNNDVLEERGPPDGPDGGPAAVAARLAEAKALACLRERWGAGARGTRSGGPLVVAADTVAVLDGRRLGKPGGMAEAETMLASLSGRTHAVVTALTVLDTATGQRRTAVETTQVEFRVLTPAQIARYTATGEPMGKAGAYALQGAGSALVEAVRGSVSNVVGLPMELLETLLAEMDG